MAFKSLKGDFSELQQLAAELEALSKAASNMQAQAARDLQAKALSQFAAAKGPDDQPWKPRQDGQKAVQGPASQIKFIATSSGIKEIVPDVLQYHQDTRPTIPTGQSLPAPWDEALTKSFEKSIKGIIKPKP